jgi:hypothetical protein
MDISSRDIERYLALFEEAVQQQIEVVGKEKALDQARRAGLGVSGKGHIVSCAGNPMLVLLRLIKCFTEDSNLQALTKCTPLIDEMENLRDRLELEEKTTA